MCRSTDAIVRCAMRGRPRDSEVLTAFGGRFPTGRFIGKLETCRHNRFEPLRMRVLLLVQGDGRVHTGIFEKSALDGLLDEMKERDEKDRASRHPFKGECTYLRVVRRSIS